MLEYISLNPMQNDPLVKIAHQPNPKQKKDDII